MIATHPVLPEPTNRPAALLRAAADRIDRYGLFQGEYWPITPGGISAGYIPGDPCCALGALAVAAGYDDALLADAALDARPELVAATDALTAQLNPCARAAQVSVWNDHPGRTATEVTAALRAAAAALDPDEPDPPPTAHLSAGLGGPSATSFHRAGPASSTHQHGTRQETRHV